MNIIGYLIAVLGLYGLYSGKLLLGSFLFIMGGFVAKKLLISTRSLGVTILLISSAYGYHNEFTPFILFLMFVGFVMACFNSRSSTRDAVSEWGFDFDFSSSGNDSGGDSGGSGD